jgi:hypothetical protein
MSETNVYKFFDTPQFHDAEFYKDREVSDHINEGFHRARLIRALNDILLVLNVDDKNIKTIGDFGCGNGGLLSRLHKAVEGKENVFGIYGYELSPKAAQYANEVNKVAVTCCDFVNEEDIMWPDILVVTEVLEHLIDPFAFVKKAKAKGVKWIVASVPIGETPESHYEFHLWGFQPKGFRELFKSAGYAVFSHTVHPPSQHIIAKSEEIS